MPTFRPLLALTLAALSLATPVQALDVSEFPESPVEAPEPVPDTPERPPDVCFEHNPRAFTNLCFTYEPRSVAGTGVSKTDGTGTCVVGNECITMQPESHKIPGYRFYVELTLLCNAGREPCRIEN